MIDTVLVIVFPVLLVIACAGWSWWNWKQSSQVLQQAQALQVFARLNDELNARVQNRVKVVNTQLRQGQQVLLGNGVMVNSGADVEAQEQPPISQTAMLDEAHEVLREMKRYRNPDAEYDKRDSFADFEEV